MLLKQIIVVVRAPKTVGKMHTECDDLSFKAKRDYLSVVNTDDGLLIINDVSHERDTNNRVLDQIAVFNRNTWIYWRENVEEH